MKIKLIILIISQSILSYGQSEIGKGDTLYVLAKSGLQLREEPNLISNRIKTVEYGESVIMNEQSILKDTIEHRIGNWLKVNYQNVQGYIFDGFLTKYHPPTNDELRNGDLTKYMFRIHKIDPQENCMITFMIPSKSEKEGGPISVIRLSENIVYREVTNYECRTHQFIFSEFRQSELYSLIDLFYSNWTKNSTNLENEMKTIDSDNNWSVNVPGYGMGFDYHVELNEALISFYECN